MTPDRVPAAPLLSDPDRDRVLEEVELGFPAAVATLSDLVRIPSVAWPGFDHADVLRSAEAVAGLATSSGVFDRVEVARAAAPDGTMGQPAVLARREARNGAPTILLYAHHDVQPPGDDGDWRTPPYAPTLADGRLYGRGASDDKAGVVTHLAAIRAAAAALGEDFDTGVALFVEGEEEYGSASFSALLAEHRELLAADVVIVADSGNESTVRPALTTSLRGAVAFNLTVSTLAHASHSGMFGGAVPDAMLAAIRLLDTLWDADGAVAVAGLRALAASDGGADAATLAADTGLLEGVRPIGRGSTADRVWRSPAITVTGIDAPSIRNASNTLVPSVTVRISARVAPGQAAEEAWGMLRRHLEEHAPFGARLEFGDVDLGEPFLVDVTGWAARAAAAALAAGWGAEVEHVGVGGSIPFISTLAAAFPEAQVLVTGVEDPASRAHSPNESQDLGVLKKAIRAEAVLLAETARRRLRP